MVREALPRATYPAGTDFRRELEVSPRTLARDAP